MEVTSSNNAPAKKRRKLWVTLGVGASLVGGAVLLILLQRSPAKTFAMGTGLQPKSPAKIFAMGKGLQPKDTEFIVGRCSDTVDGPGRTFNEGLRSSDWDEAGHLLVKYAIATNCLAPFNYGGYKLAGEKLTLEYSIFWKPTTMPDGRAVVMKTACTCGYDLKYRISGLKRKNYSIDIVEVEKR